TNTQTSPSNSELTTTNTTPPTNVVRSTRYYLKIILICVLILCIITSLIVFSIVIAQQSKNQASTTSTITTSLADPTISIVTATMKNSITSTTMTVTTTNKSTCQLKIQSITIERQWHLEYIEGHAIGDFNGDNRLDIAFVDNQNWGINVLVGNGNGTFGTRIISLQNQVEGLKKLSVGDFNNDHKLDLAATDPSNNHIVIFLGNGAGSFEIKQKLQEARFSVPESITIGDFNNDNYSDIAVTFHERNQFNLFVSNRDGTFRKEWPIRTGPNSYPSNLVVADFNCDNHQDIAVVNVYAKNIGIFIGDGNKNFEPQKTSFTGGGEQYPFDLAVGDFNSDNILDIVVSYLNANYINVMFGYGNGSVGDAKMFITGTYTEPNQIIVSDFNNDQYLDIGFGNSGRSLNVLFGFGNGNFELQTVFPTRFQSRSYWIGVGDFNGDGHEDIICANGNDPSYDVFLITCE
ncbi:unnamed protein product, partial [Adineta steineri]